MELVLEFADNNGIEKPSTSKHKGRQTSSDQKAKRQRVDFDPILLYRENFNEILDVFIDHLSEKFQLDSYKPLIAISNLLLSKKKPELGELFLILLFIEMNTI